MAETVVYVSKTGFTERYARMLAERLASVNRVQVPLFYLRGGLDYSRMGRAEGALLRKLVPKVMGVGTDGATRKMFAEGGDFVSEENLADVAAFLAKRGDGDAEERRTPPTDAPQTGKSGVFNSLLIFARESVKYI